MNNRFENRLALVTGGAGGVGMEVVKLLHAQGARVAVSDLNEQGAHELANALGDRVIAGKHDVSNEDDWRSAIDRAQQRFSLPLSILVNNAGILLAGNIETGTLADLRKLFQVNTESIFIGCQQGILAMKEHGGSIINTASISSWFPMADFVAYGASKSAVASITRAAALHCRKSGYDIRVNSVHPDGIYSPMTQAVMPEGVTAEMMLYNPKHNINGRMCMPERIAQLIVFLASDESSVVSGSELRGDNAILGMGV